MKRLEIYIADHCENCDEALRLAALARALPEVEARVINVDSEPETVPAFVVATPMYLLDGQVVALGNPAPHDLFRILGHRHPRVGNGHGADDERRLGDR